MLSAQVALTPSIEYKALCYEISKSTPNWQFILDDINAEIANVRANNEFERFIKIKNSSVITLDN
ncbi:hypothetical protein LOC50_07655 [Pseudoalteromonas sp. SCSIO 43095]|uniref:hypothetical protein n=1 Tax=Pseudoalteromonas sp. SCSIO 43095 TaxID=2894202 RepID=UPI00202B6AD7|nr:hypothetical protein [Pseudoalteromonas sp. SCSIO 43095]URQ97564.1 hypothetical protein LOC50_07655 [Pseudoalteromonas sp. SCSIO 43095]